LFVKILQGPRVIEKLRLTRSSKIFRQLFSTHACESRRQGQRFIHVEPRAFLPLLKRNTAPSQGFARCSREFYFTTKRAFDFVQNWHQRACSSASRMRSDVWPSQNGGCSRGFLAVPFSVAFAAAMIFAVSVPTMTFVPISTVIGRSVFSRSVRQGMPSAVVSS